MDIKTKVHGGHAVRGTPLTERAGIKYVEKRNENKESKGEKRDKTGRARRRERERENTREKWTEMR